MANKSIQSVLLAIPCRYMPVPFETSISTRSYTIWDFDEMMNCISRAPLLLLRSWVALSCRVCLHMSWGSVSPDQISVFSQYVKAYKSYADIVPARINQFHLILTQYHQVPMIAVLYWPSTQLHNLLMHSWANCLMFLSCYLQLYLANLE